MKKRMLSATMLVFVGLMVGCTFGGSDNIKATTTNINYSTEILEDRIKLITYVDEKNGNVVYIGYDTSYSNGNRIEGFGMTSQPLKEK